MTVQLEDHLEQLRKRYGEDAENYDENRFGDRAGALYCEAHYTALFKLLQPSLKRNKARGLRVLDIATGTGRTALRLAGGGVEVVGLDLTPAMLQVARRKKRRDGKRVDFVQGDAFALPFAENSFDVVICCRLLQMIPRDHYVDFGKEAGRVLKGDGVLIVELWNRLYRRLRCAGRISRNSWGMMDTYIDPADRQELFGDRAVAEEMAGLGFPLILRSLGRLSPKWGLKTYMMLSQNILSKRWGETFLVRYGVQK